MMFLCFVFVFFFYIYGDPLDLHVLTPSFPTLRSSDLREAVRIAFPPHLAVADDVDAQFLLIADRHQRRGFLRIGEPWVRDAPQRLGTHARRQAGIQPLAVDQPVRLGVASDDRRGQDGMVEQGCSSRIFGRYSIYFVLYLFHSNTSRGG